MLSQSTESCDHIVKSKKIFLVTLTLMSMAGLVGSDLYLPTLPNIGAALGQSSHAMQATLGVYLFGLAIGQLFLGPISDCYGRKKLLILGMIIYFLSSLSCASSFSYYQLIISRLFQALGACSGLVIGRAIIGDLYDAKEAGKIFSTIFPFVGMSPAISPVIGGFIGHYFGWQATFIFIALFALAVVFLVYFYLTETLLESKKTTLHIMKIISTYPKILMDKKFLFYASAPCFAYVAYFAYISQSPFIFSAHGFGAREIGMFYVTLSLTYVSGNMVGKALLKKIHINEAIRMGYFAFNIGAFLLLISGIAHLSLLTMVISISVLTFGNGFLIPLGTAGVVSSCSKGVGSASGLLGFLQLGLASLSSGFVDAISQNSIARMGGYLFVITMVGFVVHYYLRPRENSSEAALAKTS